MNGNKNLSDEQIVKLAQKGNSEAEEQLIRKYKDMVKAKSRLYFMAGADRDDIVQEGMIGMFRAIRSYDSEKEAAFSTFAELCITRQILSAVKGANRLKHSPLNTSISLNKPVSEEDSDTLGETLSSDSDTDPEAVLLLKEVMDYINENEDKLFSELEMKVWNRYLQGKSYVQIAQEMGKSPKTVDNAIQRTKRKMAAYMGGDNR